MHVGDLGDQHGRWHPLSVILSVAKDLMAMATGVLAPAA